MHPSFTDRARRHCLLAAVFVAVPAVMWWCWPSSADAVVLARMPASALVDGLPDHADVCSVSAAAADGTATPLPAPALRLEGTVVAGAASFAMVRHTTDSQLLQLRIGDSVDGFVVTGIESNRVALSGGTQRIVIEVEPQALAAAPALPPGATEPAPQLIPTEQLPEAYRGPAPEDEVLGH